MRQYNEPRPVISAELRRAVEVESGHACAVVRCGEHTYLEIHHINENREDNRVENLILLCDKHHKMAHAGIIDRKSLGDYKRLLKESYSVGLAERVRRLEELLARGTEEMTDSSPTGLQGVVDPDLPVKSATPRADLMYLTLEQLALTRFEREIGLTLERGLRFSRSGSHLNLDAVRQDDDLPEDLVVEVRWLRKRYMDGPIWAMQIDAATSTYEMLTGRKARGVLIFVVPKDSMRNVQDLHWTTETLSKLERQPQVVIYTYADLGFSPGAISSELFASNLK